MSFPIHLSHITHRLGKHFALRDLSLRVPQGAVYGLLGPNGSGKTTVMRLLMGMSRAEEGSVIVAGHELPDGAANALATVGYVPERFHLYRGLTVAHALSFHAAFYPRWDVSMASQLLDDYALRRDQVIGAMSKGESGKLMMLMALATRPSVLLLDEPTDGLDPVARRDMLSSVLSYVAETGATVLITSHLIHDVERMCDWVGLMDDGAVVMESPLVTFRDALRRLRVQGASPALGSAPFSIVARRNGGRIEEWVVRGFGAEGRAWMTAQGMELLDVQSMDLEETVVELLRSARTPIPAGGR
jgi:ABC-2 type transport system ATP-binding protein